MRTVLEKNAVYQAEITGMTSDGNGVAKINGCAVFVPETAPGDRLNVKIVKVLKNYSYGIIEQLLTPSAVRTENDCDVFRQCGGCCYRHINYQEELRIKEQQVKDAMERLGGIQAPFDPIAGSAVQEEYRNKAQFPIGINEHGKAVIGYYASRSHRLIRAEHCKLVPEMMNRIARDVVRFINKYKGKVYDEKTGTGTFRHIYLRRGETTGEIMLCIVSAQKMIPKQALFVSFMTERFPEIKTIILNYNSEKTNVILGRESTVLHGDGYIRDTICGVAVRISHQAFYQVNRIQAERLYEQAIQYAGLNGNETILDLYCGIGTIGLSAVKKAGQLIGVEVIPQAVQDAEKNAVQNGYHNARFIAADCNGAVQRLEADGIHPDIIFVDPPRKGCDSAVIDTLTRLAPEKIVMVSCNPSTAARDCRLLTEQGYQVERWQAFDLFPRTKHVECVVLMSKVEG